MKYEVYRKGSGVVLGTVNRSGNVLDEYVNGFSTLVNQIKRGLLDDNMLLVVEQVVNQDGFKRSNEIYKTSLKKLFTIKRRRIRKRSIITKEVRAKIEGLREKGFSIRKIAKRLGVSTTPVVNTLNP